MAPIRKGDGTAVAPTEISEVRTGDGSVIYSAIPDSAIAHWKMDEGSGSTVADSINTYDGTLNGPAWASGYGAGGYHLTFDGTDDRLPLDGGDALPFGDGDPFTYAVWINPDKVSPSGDRIDIFGNDGGRRQLALNNTIELKGYDGTQTFANGDTTLASGSWQMIGVAFDGSTATFNLNGSSDGSGSWSSNEGSYDDGFCERAGDERDYYDGAIGQAIVADKAWSDSEFQDYYDSTVGNYQ